MREILPWLILYGSGTVCRFCLCGSMFHMSDAMIFSFCRHDMKVALYAGTYVKDKDGAVRSIYQLVSSMIKNGHQVVVWTPDFTPEANARCRST